MNKDEALKVYAELRSAADSLDVARELEARHVLETLHVISGTTAFEFGRALSALKSFFSECDRNTK